MPGPPAGTVLAETIDEVAEHFSLPSFLPHITIIDDCVVDLATATTWLTELSSITAPMRAELGQPEAQESYFLSLTLPITGGEQLTLLASAAHWLTGDSRLLNFSPHVSLLYSWKPLHPATPRYQRLVEQLPLTTVFDELALVELNGGADQWRIVARTQLAAQGSESHGSDLERGSTP